MLRAVWRYAKLVCGLLLAAIAVIGLFPNETVERFGRLEAEGRRTQGVVTGMSVRREKLPAHLLSVAGPIGGFAGGVIAGRRAALELEGRSEEDPASRFFRYVEYSFITASGETVRSQAEIAPADHAAMSKGDRIEVLYHPLTPAIHRLPHHSQPYEPVPRATMYATALTMMAFGGFLVLRNLPGWPPAPKPVAPAANTTRRGFGRRGV